MCLVKMVVLNEILVIERGEADFIASDTQSAVLDVVLLMLSRSSTAQSLYIVQMPYFPSRFRA